MICDYDGFVQYNIPTYEVLGKQIDCITCGEKGLIISAHDLQGKDRQDGYIYSFEKKEKEDLPYAMLQQRIGDDGNFNNSGNSDYFTSICTNGDNEGQIFVVSAKHQLLQVDFTFNPKKIKR